MIDIKLTTTQGTEKTISFDEIAKAHIFIENLPKRLNKTTRVRVDCDLLSLNGWIQGTQ